MKKSILNGALLSMLFVLGACSVLSEEDNAFLDKVKGKYVYKNATGDHIFGKFSDDGKELSDRLVFERATDDNTGVYSINGDANTDVTFTIKDDNTGTANSPGNSSHTFDIWYTSIKR